MLLVVLQIDGSLWAHSFEVPVRHTVCLAMKRMSASGTKSVLESKQALFPFLFFFFSSQLPPVALWILLARQALEHTIEEFGGVYSSLAVSQWASAPPPFAGVI